MFAKKLSFMEVFLFLYYTRAMHSPIHHNPDFIHHQKQPKSSTIRELVFGMEDGMVSTMGAVTGIAIGSGNHYTVLLAGFVIIAVESISMGVGSYLSSKSKREIDERKLAEERIELKAYPKEEEEELVGMYVQDGWSKALAKKMAREASQNKDLFLQEMAYRELKVFPDELEEPKINALVMGSSYIIGGAIPLIPYFFSTSMSTVVPLSVVLTLCALFGLGAYTARFSKRSWWKAGLEMFTLAGVAAFVGYIVGAGVERFL